MIAGMLRGGVAAALVCVPYLPVSAQSAAELAAKFGARPTIDSISLSPDGTQLAITVPDAGQGTYLVVRSVADDAKPRTIMQGDGKKEQLSGCRWISNQRLSCRIGGVVDVEGRKLGFSRTFALDADGKNLALLSKRENSNSRGLQLGGGSVIDWLPDEEGAVLMTRVYLPDDHIGSNIGSKKEGLGVDRIDSKTMRSQTVEPPRPSVGEYISDGRGNVRIMGLMNFRAGLDTGVISYRYRKPGSREWNTLGDYDSVADEGFNPYAVDPTLNVAFGFKKKDGREALYSVALDGSLKETLLYARTDVDVDRLARIGRRNRVVGVGYQTDVPQVVYFDPEIKQIASALSRAIPQQPNIHVVDSSVDERKLLIFADSDNDPGVYYLFDRDKRDLHILFPARGQLAGIKLATMSAIRYKAADGTEIPAYLTLPPGVTSVKGLPAIVMPHGGPSYRDSWGFDWLPQFYAARGYAVIQPQFRGSGGYGDDWYQKNGFQSWRSAIGDVVDAGRWLVAQGANAKKLAIVGWSYGGYAALQSAVVAPDLFKAAVAVAPVTDLAMLKSESAGWTDARITRDFVGAGPHVREGSPAQNVDKIKVPVLLLHGTMDANVDYTQSTYMASRLKSAGGKVQLITFEGLDHQLEDSTARTRLLSESDQFLQAAFAS